MIDDSLTPYSELREFNKAFKTTEGPSDQGHTISHINIDSHMISDISKVPNE